MMCNSIV